MKPILFNTEMVKAILDGRKTVTRRLMKIQPWGVCDSGNEHQLKDIFKETPREFCCRECGLGVGPTGHSLFKSPYQIGDIIYVRETWCDPTPDHDMYPILYKADFPQYYSPEETEWGGELTLTGNEYKWRPSIHMPKEAARIFLRVTNVRVERLHEMNNAEARKEGMKKPLYPLGQFIDLWNSIVKEDGKRFETNPWVWVIEFERCEKPELLEGIE